LGEVQEGLGSFTEEILQLSWLPGETSPRKLRPTKTHVYAATLGVWAIGLFLLVSTVGGGIRAPWWVIGALSLTALLGEQQSVRVTSHTGMSVSVLPVLFAAILFGPAPAMIVGASALVGDFRQPYARWVVWTCQRAIGGGLAGIVAVAVGTHTAAFGRLLGAVAAASLTEAIADVAQASATALVRKNDVRETMRSLLGLQLAAVPLYTPVIALLAYAYERGSPWLVFFFFVPALAAQRLFLLYQEQRNLAERLARANDRLERANLSFASALVATLDARDRYTAGHSAAVAIYSRDIAARIGLGGEQQNLVHLCGLVHDIGKVGLPAHLLEKTGALSLEERRQMEEHSEIGQRILSKVDDYAEIALVVRHHHERVDGNGYPDGLHGSDIPLLSRIIAVADAYNAMTSDRPYRDAMPSRVARLRLAQAVESQFDTAVVAAFEAILAGATEEYRSGTGEMFFFDRQWAGTDSGIAYGGRADESRFGPSPYAELVEDAAKVSLDSHFADKEAFGYTSVRQALGK
jgi:putative nucleotidyltransferase with HDIG domain